MGISSGICLLYLFEFHFLEGASMRKLGGFFCALFAATLALHVTGSNALAVHTMADWVGRNNAPGPNYTFDSQVLNATNTAAPTDDNYVVISPTKIGGQKQAKINFNQDPNRNEFEDPNGPSNVNFPHSYLADLALEGPTLDFSKPLHMEGTLQFDMPEVGEVEPNFCFCWHNSTDTRKRIGLGLSNVTNPPLTPEPDSLRVDLFYSSAAGNGFVWATKDGTQSQEDGNSRVPDGTYSFTFDYVPGNDIFSNDTTGSSMSATITDGTNTFTSTLSPLPNAPWYEDFFPLDRFGVIIRTTGSTATRNGIFDFSISNVTYTGGTDAPVISGDHNDDGIVDAADYVAWRKDPSGHGGDPAGYDAFMSQFGSAGPGSGGAVPEPGAVACCLIGTGAWGAIGRSRRCR